MLITVNCEAKAVLISSEEYLALRKTSDENKSMVLKLALADLCARAASATLTENDIDKEIRAFRQKRRSITSTAW